MAGLAGEEAREAPKSQGGGGGWKDVPLLGGVQGVGWVGWHGTGVTGQLSWRAFAWPSRDAAARVGWQATIAGRQQSKVRESRAFARHEAGGRAARARRCACGKACMWEGVKPVLLRCCCGECTMIGTGGCVFRVGGESRRLPRTSQRRGSGGAHSHISTHLLSSPTAFCASGPGRRRGVGGVLFSFCVEPVLFRETLDPFPLPRAGPAATAGPLELSKRD